MAGHVADGVVDAALDERFELWPMRVRRQPGIRQLKRLGNGRTVLRPERIGEGERCRRVTQADHDGQVALFEAIPGLAAVEVVVGEAARLAEAGVGERVEKEPVFAGG